MTEKYTGTLTFTRRGKDSDNGKWASFLEPGANKWCRIHMGHADKIQVGQPADVEYAVTERGGVFINKVNGTDVSKAPQQPTGGLGSSSGPLGSKPAAGPLGAPPAASGHANKGAWADMGPENRARMAAEQFVRDMYKGTGTHPGQEALARDYQLTYAAWLQGCEGKGMPPAAGNSAGYGAQDNMAAGEDLSDPIPFDDSDPGPQGMDDYGQ